MSAEREPMIGLGTWHYSEGQGQLIWLVMDISY